MAAEFKLRPRARRDLEDIHVYTLERWSSDQAQAYVRLLNQAMRALAAAPETGRSMDDVRSGVLKFSVGSHFIVYRRTTTGIDVLRILHQRMDLARHLS